MSIFPFVLNFCYELHSTWEYILIYWILIEYSASFWIKHVQLFFFSKIKLRIYFTLQTLLGFPNVNVLSDGERSCFGMQVMNES